MFGASDDGLDDAVWAGVTQAAKRPKVGVGVMIFNEDGAKVLFGKRLKSLGYGFYSFPGGHIENGETVIQAAVRELFEETGLRMTNMVFAGYTDDIYPDGTHYITLYVEGDYESGELKNTEPDKTESWEWHDVSTPPQPLWEPIKKFFKEASLSKY